MSRGTLYVVVCGAGPASKVLTLVEMAQQQGWSVHCLVTPAAVEHFLDVEALAKATNHSVRSGYRQPGHSPLPVPDAVIVAPATYNTINKWAGGIADTYVLNQLAELAGVGVPIVVLPFVNQALAANNVFIRSVAALREAGVRVLFGPGEFEPHPPRTGGGVIDAFPWHLALKEAHHLASTDGVTGFSRRTDSS